MKTSIFVTTVAGPLFLVWRDLYFPHLELQNVLLFNSPRLRLVTQSPLWTAATTPTMGDDDDVGGISSSIQGQNNNNNNYSSQEELSSAQQYFL